MSKISDELCNWASHALRLWVLHARSGEHMDLHELDAIADRIDNETVELPRDRDGVPIHVGDTVYLDDGRKAEVTRIELSHGGHGIAFSACGNYFSAIAPENFTHTRPDSWERIADELLAWCDGADVDGDACGKPRDLADRIRRLAKKEGTR